MAVDGAWRSPLPSMTAPSTAFGWISGFGSGSASVGLWLDLAFIHLDFWLDLVGFRIDLVGFRLDFGLIGLISAWL